MASNLQPVRGTRDLLGRDILFCNKVIGEAKRIARLYNFDEIATPIFEFSEVFYRTLGDTSDIVSKETYTFLDRDKTSITLRPEFTAGVVRAFISNGLTQNLPQKFISSGPIFRHERPQKCRYRQFNQINCELIGSKDPNSDVEAIQLAIDILSVLGLKEYVKLEINSLGDAESRLNYKQKLIDYFTKYESELSEDSKMRLEKNPLRILDSKDENDKKLVRGAPRGIDCFTDAAKDYFAKVLSGLDNLGINYVTNDKLVRGLDYYTHTVFEFTTERLGSQGTVLAGGRYDGLVELMGGPSTPAVGFAAGVERLAELMQELGAALDTTGPVSLIPVGENAEEYAQKLAKELRANNIATDFEFTGNIAKRMKRANKINSPFAIIFGADELDKNIFKIKNMTSGEEHVCDAKDLVNKLLSLSE
jgi:histidyl-tRNA synthetase